MRGAGLSFRLVRCDPAGEPVEPLGALPSELAQANAASAALFQRIGYVAPWVSYVAVADGAPVGGGAFVGPPRDARVEIAYFTLPEHAGKGHATNTARGLVEIARASAPDLTVVAFTLSERNASNHVLEKLGFRHRGLAEDADAGTVWEWRLEPSD